MLLPRNFLLSAWQLLYFHFGLSSWTLFLWFYVPKVVWDYVFVFKMCPYRHILSFVYQDDILYIFPSFSLLSLSWFVPIFFLHIFTLILLTLRIWWASNNASRWQMGFNSVFNGLIWAYRNFKYSFSFFSIFHFWGIIPVNWWEFLCVLHPFAVYSCTVHLSLFYFLCGKSPHILYFLNIMFCNVLSVYFHSRTFIRICV